MRFVVLLIGFLPLCSLAQEASTLTAALTELDRLVKDEHEYATRKENELLQLKEQLTGAGGEERFVISLRLAKEYEHFTCDSAIVYAQSALSIATERNNNTWINDSRIQLARCEAKAGMFNNAIDRLDRLPRGELSQAQRMACYETYIDAYIYWLEYQNGYEIAGLQAQKEKYQDSLLAILSPNTLEYALRKGFRLIEQNRLDSAESLLLPYYYRIEKGTKECARIASILSFLYKRKNDLEKEKEFLSISAIADIRSAVRENISLRTLSIILFNEGDITRADRYIKKSLDDANFYNARLRNIQASRILPIIDKAYQKDREAQQQKLRALLLLACILSVILIISVLLIRRQIKALRIAQTEILNFNSRLKILNEDLQAANERQKLTNIHLAEANHIKEKFIGQFLDITTEHIDRLEGFKLVVHRKLKAGQVNDVISATSATSLDAAKELKTLYASFDMAFLNIYPDFVEEFNKLLKPDQRYTVTDERSLNQELRVFALLRLGITDSNKIATFLHYSLRTIYNYRSKVKSKALHPEDNFEEKVRQIGMLSA